MSAIIYMTLTSYVLYVESGYNTNVILIIMYKNRYTHSEFETCLRWPKLYVHFNVNL